MWKERSFEVKHEFVLIKTNSCFSVRLNPLKENAHKLMFPAENVSVCCKKIILKSAS
jgi:hypothetical protein